LKTLLPVVALVALLGCDRSAPTPPAQQQPTPRPAEKTELPPGHPPLNAGDTKLPAGHPPVDMASQSLPPGTGSAAGNPTWTVPAGWVAGKTTSVRRGVFNVSGPDGQAAEVVVTVFPGDVGGLAMNVNRWRGQLGLEPVADAAVAGLTAPLEVGAIKATVVDLTGKEPLPEKKNVPRMLVAVVPQAGNTWFIKMVGDEPLVAAQKDTFLKFAQSVKF
jgi:hypothetical protein